MTYVIPRYRAFLLIFCYLCFMRRLAAILLLTSYMLSATELYEFVKLPMLVKHYIEHKEENQHMTLLEFLATHYAHDTIVDKDFKDDMKLPFKSCDHATLMNVPVVLNQQESQIVIKFSEYSQDKSPVIPSLSYNDAYLSAIWQPPRMG